MDDDYEIEANATRYEVTIITNDLAGTVVIPFTITVDRDHFSPNFLEMQVEGNFIVLEFATEHSFMFIRSDDPEVEKIYRSIQDPEVMAINDSVRGPTLVIRDMVLFFYNLSSPLEEPAVYEFVINAVAESIPPDNMQASRVPFMRGSVTVIPSGIVHMYYSQLVRIIYRLESNIMYLVH